MSLLIPLTVAEGHHVLTTVLRSGDQPSLNRAQLQRVHRASVAHKEYLANHPDSDDEGPEDDDAWLYEDLMLLAKLYSRLRDREQLIALIFEVCRSVHDDRYVRYERLTGVIELGHHSGSIEGYHYNFLLTACPSLSRSQYRRLPW